MTASELSFDAIFRGGYVPPGLRRLSGETAGEALEDLLLGRAVLGHLAPADPVELALGWFDVAGAALVAVVDSALEAWIDRAWGEPELGQAGASLTGLAWCHAADLVAAELRMKNAAAALRRHVPEEQAFLAAFGEGPARDPLGRAWRALARHQPKGDRGLIDRWWHLCSLEPDVPWYHGAYGILGLRHITPSRAARVRGSGFPVEVGEGLLRLAGGLARRVREGWLEREVAGRAFRRTASLTQGAYPNLAARWIAFWNQALHGRRADDDLVQQWVRELDLERIHGEPNRRKRRQPQWMEPVPQGADRVKAIIQLFRQDKAGANEAAKQLLEEQQEYAEATGDTFFFVRSACKLATAVRQTSPEEALRWVERANRLDPDNDHAWTLGSNLLLQLDRPREAQKSALEAVRRFSQDPVAMSTLVESLLALERYAEAESVCRDGHARFPEADRLTTQLGEVYRAWGRVDAAETAYREAMELLPDDPVPRCGLAEVYRAQGRYGEARDLYEQALAIAPNDHARTALRALHREIRQAAEVAEPAAEYDAKPPREPWSSSVPSEVPPGGRWRRDDVEILLHDAYLLRRWGRQMNREATPAPAGALRQRARHLLAALVSAGKRSAAAAGEAGLLQLDEGELDDALALLQAAVARFPGSGRVRYALARAERLRAARERPTLDPARPGELILPWRRLGRLDEQLRPVEHLGSGRTWLTLANGSLPEAAAHGARNAFGRLGYWIQQTLDAELLEQEEAEGRRTSSSGLAFLAYQARNLRESLFGGDAIARAEDIGDLEPYRERLAVHAFELDQIEESFVHRLAI